MNAFAEMNRFPYTHLITLVFRSSYIILQQYVVFLAHQNLEHHSGQHRYLQGMSTGTYQIIQVVSAFRPPNLSNHFRSRPEEAGVRLAFFSSHHLSNGNKTRDHDMNHDLLVGS